MTLNLDPSVPLHNGIAGLDWRSAKHMMQSHGMPLMCMRSSEPSRQTTCLQHLAVNSMNEQLNIHIHVQINESIAPGRVGRIFQLYTLVKGISRSAAAYLHDPCWSLAAA